MMNRVFVYGTLQPGQSRWPALAGFVSRDDPYSQAMATGRLYDIGYGWPAAVFGGAADDQIPGIMLGLAPDTVDDALVALDSIEGVEAGLFERVAIDVDRYQCWAYQWRGDTEGFRRIQKWPSTLAPGR